jgi:hypothetical protein
LTDSAAGIPRVILFLFDLDVLGLFNTDPKKKTLFKTKKAP